MVPDSSLERVTPWFGSMKPIAFYGGDPVLGLGHHGGHRELWLGSIGHELCNLLLFEHIETDDTAKQGECYQQHDGHPLFMNRLL